MEVRDGEVGPPGVVGAEVSVPPEPTVTGPRVSQPSAPCVALAKRSFLAFAETASSGFFTRRTHW
ncbi:hypothetical protein [[Actinomadura] parvosata]|uniref:hypothetical protein n=1 Tax=[Actinomadura] parvosata TaxID=1955412 RepID=UPI001C9269C1